MRGSGSSGSLWGVLVFARVVSTERCGGKADCQRSQPVLGSRGLAERVGKQLSLTALAAPGKPVMMSW